MTTNLTPELQEQIRKEAKAEAKKMTARVPVFRIGYEYGHYDGAEVYAEKWQEEKELRERYEKALKEIKKGLNWIENSRELDIIHEALTPKTSTDDTANR